MRMKHAGQWKTLQNILIPQYPAWISHPACLTSITASKCWKNSEALEKIGVTIGKDGKLSIDQEKLGEASIEDIQAVFAGSNGLAAKTAYIAERAADNAHAGTQSVSGQYNAAGTLSSQLASRYDFWG